LDASTLKICESNPDIDTAAVAFVRLLANCKGEQMHGQAGVLAEHKAGKITVLHHRKEPTTLIKT
jgi:hypothetical protein